MSINPPWQLCLSCGGWEGAFCEARGPLGLVLCSEHEEEPGGDRWVSASSGEPSGQPWSWAEQRGVSTGAWRGLQPGDLSAGQRQSPCLLCDEDPAL